MILIVGKSAGIWLGWNEGFFKKNTTKTGRCRPFLDLNHSNRIQYSRLRYFSLSLCFVFLFLAAWKINQKDRRKGEKDQKDMNVICLTVIKRGILKPKTRNSNIILLLYPFDAKLFTWKSTYREYIFSIRGVQ